MTLTEHFLRSRRLVRAVALLVVLVLVLAACGDDGEEAGPLRVATPQPLEGLNTHGIDGAGRVPISASIHIFDTLVVPNGTDFAPSLATSWERTDDLTWVFHLRDDVNFHDGTPLTANDVKVSLEQIFTQNGRLVQIWNGFESIEATDDHTVTIRTTVPMGTMLNNLTLLFIHPARVADDIELYNQDPIGSGAYKVVSFTPSEILQLEVNEDYWGPVPSIREMEWVWIPESSAISTGLVTGEIDFTWELDPDQLSTIRDEEGLKIETIPSWIYYMNVINHTMEPLGDIRVRQALWHAIDTQKLIDDLFAGTGAQMATAPIPSTVFGWKAGDIPEYDPDRARQLLKEAGHGDGLSLSMDFERNGGPQQRELAQAIISYWAAVGVQVEPLEMERALWLERLLAKEYELMQQTNPVLTGDADYTIGRLYQCGATFTFCDEELDDLINRARQSFDQNERAQLYGEAIDIIVDNAVNIFTIELPVNYVYKDNLQGFVPAPSGSPNLKGVSR